MSDPFVVWLTEESVECDEVEQLEDFVKPRGEHKEDEYAR